MIISLGGAPGSGKSTIAQMLSDKLGWPRYYMGGLRREAAKKRGLTLEEYNKLGETDPSTDLEVDEKLQGELARTQDNFIIEGRTSWYFIPQSLKIYLGVDLKEGAKRIFSNLSHKNDRNEAAGLNSEADVVESNKRRIESDKFRYQKYYNIDVYNPQNYDLYLDTTDLTREQVFEAVLNWVMSRLDNKKI